MPAIAQCIRAATSTRQRPIIAFVRLAPNPGGNLKPGLFANITMTAPNDEITMWLPVSAVATAGLPKVLMAADGEVVERDVQTGRRIGGEVEILDGLGADEAVIADVAGLGRGMPVRIVGGAPDSNS